ncbi:MAG: hypothetical protein DU429_05885 [Candidatus Tokpelaia sp.]|nr:MAG: hypothetical protein DU429_05885 [Candidatus Tokpelaia sp.]
MHEKSKEQPLAGGRSALAVCSGGLRFLLSGGGIYVENYKRAWPACLFFTCFCSILRAKQRAAGLRLLRQ